MVKYLEALSVPFQGFLQPAYLEDLVITDIMEVYKYNALQKVLQMN